MNYNIYLLGSDINFLHTLATQLTSSTNFNNIISLFEIKKTINSKKLSKHYLSKALFYEDIDNNFYKNNIIIPEQKYDGNDLNEFINHIRSYQRDKLGIVCIVKSDWDNYIKEKNNIVKYYDRCKLIDNYYSADNLFDENNFNYFQNKLEYIYKNQLIVPIHKVFAGEDLYTATINFTDFCINNKLKFILNEEE